MAVADPGMTMCTKCLAQWGGMNTCHCTACHQTFSGITAFSAHRLGYTEGPKRPRGGCQTMEDAGLVLADRKYTCYTIPQAVTEEED